MLVLIAEDNKDTANIYRIALKSRGHDVTTASDGLECLEIYKNASSEMAARKETRLSPYDVVVLDYRMPKLDGLETAKAILKIHPDQRLIFASAYVKNTLHDSVKNLHKVVELIEKPFEPKTLVEHIENVYPYQELTRISALVIDMDIQHLSISGDDILRGLTRMNSIFGTSILSALIKEVQDHGVKFEKDNRYLASDLQSLLMSVFGDHVGVFLMRFFAGYFTKDPLKR